MSGEGEVKPKRKRKEKTWKRNEIPSKKAKGEEHVNLVGKAIPARKSGPECK